MWSILVILLVNKDVLFFVNLKSNWSCWERLAWFRRFVPHLLLKNLQAIKRVMANSRVLLSTVAEPAKTRSWAHKIMHSKIKTFRHYIPSLKYDCPLHILNLVAKWSKLVAFLFSFFLYLFIHYFFGPKPQ